MPDVRLAATGMDSCPASDEDTEDELEAARTHSFRTNASRNTSRTQLLLPSTSRQLVRKIKHFARKATCIYIYSPFLIHMVCVCRWVRAIVLVSVRG